jgi:hypothetical protein
VFTHPHAVSGGGSRVAERASDIVHIAIPNIMASIGADLNRNRWAFIISLVLGFPLAARESRQPTARWQQPRVLNRSTAHDPPAVSGRFAACPDTVCSDFGGQL